MRTEGNLLGEPSGRYEKHIKICLFLHTVFEF